MGRLVLALMLAGCGPPCEDLVDDLCSDCPGAERARCESAMGRVQDAANDEACALERDVFTCSQVGG